MTLSDDQSVASIQSTDPLDDQPIANQPEHIENPEESADTYITNLPEDTSIIFHQIDQNQEHNSISTIQSTMTTEITLNGVVYKVNSKATARAKDVALYDKKARKAYKDKDRIDLLDKIQANQQIKFHSITVSVNDPEKMTNTHSIAKILAENKRNLLKYDLLDVFTIIVPHSGAFDADSDSYGRLEMKNETEPVQYDLFTDYLRLTPQQVGASSKWYSGFVPDEELMQENLNWSLAYYERNVEKALFDKVHANLMNYPSDEQGGPLFLKLLLDRVTTTSQANLAALKHIVDSYRIKTSCKGEDIETVVSLFTAVFDNISSLGNGDLPDDSTKKLLRIFQSTSVPSFNDLFQKQEQELFDADLKMALNPGYLNSIKLTGATVLTNDMASVKFILAYAEKAYRNYVRNGEWDKCLQKPPGQAAFIANINNNQQSNGTGSQSTRFNQTGSSASQSISKTNACFNCEDENCNLKICPHERDAERIARNKAKHPRYIRIRETFEKYKPPADGESHKRVIDGKPHTWNPNIGRNGRWVIDTTPSDGQSNNGAPPNTQIPANPPAQINLSSVDSLTAVMRTLLSAKEPDSSGTTTGDSSSISGSTITSAQNTDVMERKLQLHLLQKTIENELNRL
jgi:hypothetical protein